MAGMAIPRFVSPVRFIRHLSHHPKVVAVPVAAPVKPRARKLFPVNVVPLTAVPLSAVPFSGAALPQSLNAPRTEPG
jgi:hypothetical protein